MSDLKLESQLRIDLINQTKTKLAYEIKILFESSLIALRQKRKIILIGNGGSFSIAQHISAEFTGRFHADRESIPSIVLGSNPSSFSAIANDYGYETSFKRELSSLGQKGDLLIAMSTSGKSKNIIETIKKAEEMEIKSFFLTGSADNNLKLNTTYIKIPSLQTYLIQEMHFFILHDLCKYIDLYPTSAN